MSEPTIYNEIALKIKGQQKEVEKLRKENYKLKEERDKYKTRCYKALKMIFDNYGLLDKYGIEMLEDILNGADNE